MSIWSAIKDNYKVITAVTTAAVLAFLAGNLYKGRSATEEADDEFFKGTTPNKTKLIYKCDGESHTYEGIRGPDTISVTTDSDGWITGASVSTGGGKPKEFGTAAGGPPIPDGYAKWAEYARGHVQDGLEAQVAPFYEPAAPAGGAPAGTGGAAPAGGAPAGTGTSGTGTGTSGTGTGTSGTGTPGPTSALTLEKAVYQV
jgi:hypothetical protein